MRRPDAAVTCAVVLFAIYALTLAPDVTFWDAGEFIAAAHSLGIPHPPGTPLFVLLASVWARVVPLPFAVATNLLSAVATALAAGVSARLVERGTGSWSMACAAGLVAGTMSTAWLNATETEVYAVALMLGILTIWAGERAGRSADSRWLHLTAYLMALAVPLHLSALVTAPVAIALASHDEHSIRWDRALLLTGALVLVIGIGRMSPWFAGAGALLVVSSFAVTSDVPMRVRAALPLAMLVVVGVGASAVMFLMVRAAFDPGINQGNPATWERLAAVVSRRQYAVAPLWPRAVAPWIQVANIGQYADWQVALSAGPTVLPSVIRTLATALFVWLGINGAGWHWNAHRRSWLAVAALLACGTLGVMVYLNLHAGPSIGFPGLAADALREARERDYFYVFGFWAWGLWAGIGAVVLARQLSRPAWAGVALACIPLALNWGAVTRRPRAEADLPHRWAEALLESSPPKSVLFVVGDNDTYPLWYAQQVHDTRRDVSVVTLPLLGTRWYREEMRRRFRLGPGSDSTYPGRMGFAHALADDARRQGRPVVASTLLLPDERAGLADSWTARGVVFVAGPAGIDSVETKRRAEWVASVLPDTLVRPAIDPVAAYFRRSLECPKLLTIAARSGDVSRLDSACNYR